MYHVFLIALALTVALGFWNLVHFAPRVLARIFPKTLLFVVGGGFFSIAIFSAYIASWEMREPETVIGAFVQAFVGLWFMLIASADNRGTHEDEMFLRRLFAMVLLMMGVILASLYISSYQVMASLNLVLVAAGFFFVTRFSKSRV